MTEEANTIIDGLGGTSAVHRLLSAPMSTVHSWRKNGIPPSRLAHLKLAAAAEGLAWPLDGEDTGPEQARSPECAAENIGEAA